MIFELGGGYFPDFGTQFQRPEVDPLLQSNPSHRFMKILGGNYLISQTIFVMFTKILGGGEWSNFKFDDHILPTGLKPPSGYQLERLKTGASFLQDFWTISIEQYSIHSLGIFELAIFLARKNIPCVYVSEIPSHKMHASQFLGLLWCLMNLPSKHAIKLQRIVRNIGRTGHLMILFLEQMWSIWRCLCLDPTCWVGTSFG